MRRGPLALILLGLAVIVAGLAWTYSVTLKPIDPKEFARVNDADFEEICLGRHLVSFPKGWTWTTRDFAVGNLNITRLNGAESAAALWRGRADALRSGTTDEDGRTLALRWSEKLRSAHVLAHSSPPKEGWPEFPLTVEGWIERDGIVFHIAGMPTEEAGTPEFVAALLERLRPRDGDGPPEEPGACFAGGVFTGPLSADEISVVSLANGDGQEVPATLMSLDLSVLADRAGTFDPARFGELTREFEIAGVPGGERVGIWAGELERDSGYEFLATAGGAVQDHGIQLRAAMSRQNAYPDAPPLPAEEALVIWQMLLRFIQPVGF